MWRRIDTSPLIFAAGLLGGELLAVDGGFAGEVEGEAYLVAVDLDDADEPERLLGVADDHFFADAAGEREHGVLRPWWPKGRVR